MFARHILFAGLFATASLANAALVEPAAAAAPQPAWSFNAGTAPQAAPSDAFQVMMAGPGTWTGHSRMGDRGATSTMLYSQKSFSSAPVQAAAAPAAAVEVAPAAAAAPAPVLEAPAVDASAGAAAGANTSGLVNTGVTIGADVSANIGGVAPAAVPEPATGLLMLAGLLGAGALTRRRK